MLSPFNLFGSFILFGHSIDEFGWRRAIFFFLFIFILSAWLNAEAYKYLVKANEVYAINW